MKRFVITILLFLTSFNLAQNIFDEILVEVGDLIITKSEFENRLNFTPKQGIHDRNSTDGIKKELLYTLIAEKLWANEALNEGLDTNAFVTTAKSVIEKMFVRDELYRVEIKDKINLSKEDLIEAEERYSRDLKLLVFFSENEADIIDFTRSVNATNNISKIISSIDTNKVIYKSMVLSFGDLMKDSEDILYNLHIGEFSDPIKIETGWNIFYLEKNLSKDISGPQNSLEKTKKISKILTQRNEQNNYDDFYSSFFADKKVDADGKLFNLIDIKLREIFTQKILEGIVFTDKYGIEKLLFDNRDLINFENIISKNELEKDFIKFDENPIKLSTFMAELSFSSFAVPTSNLDSIKIKLHFFIKDYIKYELLAREGYNRGLNHSPNVTKWVKMWYENFLYQAIKNKDQNELNNTLKYFESDQDQEENNNSVKGREVFDKFIDETIDLSEKYTYKINEDLLAKIKQSNINLFVMRNLGFGGTIAGVPISSLFIDWYVEKEKRASENL